MITEVVNGELRQVFDYSTPGFPAKFYAPVRVGAGYRDRIEMAKAFVAFDSEAVKSGFAEYIKNNPNKHGYPQDVWMKKLTEGYYPAMMEHVNGAEAWRIKLATLETLLVPAQGSIDVKTWYLECATESEVEEIVNFSEGKLTAKIETESSLPSTGEDTKAPKDAPLKTTSRRRSGNSRS